jgi:hypothetical protein
MNERIRELSKQAGTDLSGKWMSIDNATKFAELIVQDCYQKLIDMDQQVKSSHNYYKPAAIQIRLHFGVKP